MTLDSIPTSVGRASSSTRHAGTIVFFYELTQQGFERFGHDDASCACIEGDQALIDAGSARRLGFLSFPQAGALVEHDVLIELTSVLVDALARHTSLPDWLSRLYGSDAIDNFVRRMLLGEVDWLVAVGVVIDRDFSSFERVELPLGWPNSSSWPLLVETLREACVRERAIDLLGAPLVEALERIRIVGRDRSRAMRVARRVASAVVHTGGAWVKVLRQVRLRRCPFPPSRVVIRTYRTDWEDIPAEAGRLRRVDFVVDGNELRTDDVLIWVESGVSEARRESLRQRGYRVLDAKDVTIGLGAFVRRTLPLLLSFAARLPTLARTESWWHWPVAVLVRDRALWDEAARAFGRTTFLAYNDISASAVSRNVVLHRHGIRTVFYQHTSGSYSQLDGEWTANMAYPFLVFSAVAAWGPAHVELFRRHPGRIDEIWDVGCLWSENVRLIAADPALRDKYERMLAPHLAAPLASFERAVAVIDATIETEPVRRSWLGIHEAVLGLAQRMPNVLFLIKPKFPIEKALEAAGLEGEELVRRLEALNNVTLVPSWFETSAIVVFSDAVVGMPFTSVVVEALGAAKPGLYYDPIEQFPSVFWRRIPGMVATNESELDQRLRTLLWETGRDEYLDYLRTHLAWVEGHFDGLAITRLRRRLLALTA